MSGYANKVIKLTFDTLSEDPEKDPIWVIIRNPRIMPPGELASAADGIDVDGEGKITDREAGLEASRKVIAKLVVAARVYDATAMPEFDPQTGDEVAGTGEAVLLPPTPWEPQMVTKLPGMIITRITEEIVEAQNPS